jgi:hypothetical protein
MLLPTDEQPKHTFTHSKNEYLICLECTRLQQDYSLANKQFMGLAKLRMAGRTRREVDDSYNQAGERRQSARWALQEHKRVHEQRTPKSFVELLLRSRSGNQ